jgi:hypothetical protein
MSRKQEYVKSYRGCCCIQEESCNRMGLYSYIALPVAPACRSSTFVGNAFSVREQGVCHLVQGVTPHHGALKVLDTKIQLAVEQSGMANRSGIGVLGQSDVRGMLPSCGGEDVPILKTGKCVHLLTRAKIQTPLALLGHEAARRGGFHDDLAGYDATLRPNQRPTLPIPPRRVSSLRTPDQPDMVLPRALAKHTFLDRAIHRSRPLCKLPSASSDKSLGLPGTRQSAWTSWQRNPETKHSARLLKCAMPYR